MCDIESTANFNMWWDKQKNGIIVSWLQSQSIFNWCPVTMDMKFRDLIAWYSKVCL